LLGSPASVQREACISGRQLSSWWPGRSRLVVIPGDLVIAPNRPLWSVCDVPGILARVPTPWRISWSGLCSNHDGGGVICNPRCDMQSKEGLALTANAIAV
jgi:hypothetical protein